jgi:hypothetical protein
MGSVETTKISCTCQKKTEYLFPAFVVDYVLVLNLGVTLHEDGVNDAETCSSDIRLTVFVCMKGAFVGVINETFNLTRITLITSAYTLSGQTTKQDG